MGAERESGRLKLESPSPGQTNRHEESVRMPSVLAIVAGIPAPLVGRTVAGEGPSIELRDSAGSALAEAESVAFDLLVLAGMSVDEQQETAARFQQHRRWRVVPVLYVIDVAAAGFAVPGNYRPELDGIVRGEFASATVQARIREMAREGIASADIVVAGPYELDAIHGRLAMLGRNIEITDREAEILAILLNRVNRTVSAVEIIERGWGSAADERHLQILRRHVSNIRRKLESGLSTRALRTVRGSGYRFELRQTA
jgi:DNA-binding response OmpR family regulator